MTRAQAKQHAVEFAGVFAPAMPPDGWMALVQELDGWTNDIILELDELAKRDRERMHCQQEDCYELADISDTRTSLRYCKSHYWELKNALVWKFYKINPPDYWE